VRPYGRILGAQLRASLLESAQYRADFVIDGAIEILWTGTALFPLFLVYRGRESIAGWSFAEALVVVGFFTLLQAVLEGAINPSLLAVVEHIRKGTLDFVLLKPADAQFLVSTARFSPWRAINVVTASVIFVTAFRMMGRTPHLLDAALALLALVASVTVLYSLWILAVCAAFYVVKIDNVAFLFGAVFDAARWPSSVFRGVVSFILTFIVPLALMTTVPARALLGGVDLRAVLGALAGAAIFAVVARAVWVRSLARYTSAGG
jgi:ABC-2 type transport system permease protein